MCEICGIAMTLQSVLVQWSDICLTYCTQPEEQRQQVQIWELNLQKKHREHIDFKKIKLASSIKHYSRGYVVYLEKETDVGG